MEAIVRPAHGGHTAEFYNSETGENYRKWVGEDINHADPKEPWNLRGADELVPMPKTNEWFVTVPMMQELLAGKNIKKVSNSYIVRNK